MARSGIIAQSPWTGTLRKKVIKRKLLIVEDQEISISTKECLQVLKYKVRTAFAIPEFMNIFLLLDGVLVTEFRLQRLANKTRLTLVRFCGRRVEFNDLFQERKGIHRLTLKALGEMAQSAYIFDVTKEDTILGLKLMIYSAHYKNLRILNVPKPNITNCWSKVTQFEDDYSLWQISTEANLYLQEIEPSTSNKAARSESSSLHRKTLNYDYVFDDDFDTAPEEESRESLCLPTIHQRKESRNLQRALPQPPSHHHHSIRSNKRKQKCIKPERKRHFSHDYSTSSGTLPLAIIHVGKADTNSSNGDSQKIRIQTPPKRRSSF